jgi:two-component system cell cycle response regulator
MRPKILTVDDSKTVRAIVRRAFSGFDCEVVEAGNGLTGLEMAASMMPDLILLDETMPSLDGAGMLARLKVDPRLKPIPVVILTPDGGHENVLRFARIGIRDFVVKPFGEACLIEKAARIITLTPVGAAALAHAAAGR